MKENLTELCKELNNEEKKLILYFMARHTSKKFPMALLPFFDTLTVLSAINEGKVYTNILTARQLFEKIFIYYVESELNYTICAGAYFVHQHNFPLTLFASVAVQEKYKDLFECSWVIDKEITNQDKWDIDWLKDYFNQYVKMGK